MHHALHLHCMSGLDRVHYNDSFDFGLILYTANFQQLVFAGDKNYARPRVLQNVSRLFSCQSGVNRYHDCTEKQTREIRDSPLGPILAQDGNAIPFADTAFLQEPRCAYRALVKLRRGNRNPLNRPPVHDHHAVIPLHHGKKNVIESSQIHGQRAKTMPHAFSRGAAKECSPRRKPWVRHRKKSSPKGAKQKPLQKISKIISGRARLSAVPP
jgi:hypothetical protein